MSVNKEKEVLLCLIDMYKAMPYLWNKKDQNYINKEMRNKGFKVLIEIYKNFDENATAKTITKKIKNMRANYAKELKKVMVSKHTGEGAAKVYVPSLWYFDALSFLGCRAESCRTCQYNCLENAKSSSDVETTSVGNSSGGQQMSKKKDTLLEQQQNILLAAEKHKSQKDEEWEVYGRSIGFQMKDLNKRQLMISQKIISDVMFYAKLDQLSEYSCVVVGPPNETIPNNSGFDQRQNQFYSPSPLSNHLSPSPSHQTQSPNHSSPLYTLWPRFHTQSVRQTLLSPQQTQFSQSPSPHQPLPNAQVQVHHTQTVHQPLQSPQNQMQLSNLSSLSSSSHQLSRSYQPTSKGQVTINHSLHLPSSNAQAHYSLRHQRAPRRHRRASPNALAQKQPSRQSQELPSDSVITVENTEQFLDFFPNENSSDANSLSLPIIEGADVMRYFLN